MYAKLSKVLWEEAANTDVYIFNLLSIETYIYTYINQS